MKKNITLPKTAILKVLAFAVSVNLFPPITAYGDLATDTRNAIEAFIGTTSLVAETPLEKGKRRLSFSVTAYNSLPNQTDDTPFTTAANTHVRDGIVATNVLPFGTKVKIPELFGNKIFVVEDRMNRRYNGQNRMDIWMADYATARAFGVQRDVLVVIY